MTNINTLGHIEIDNEDTGLGFAQGKFCTIVFTRQERGETYHEHHMPRCRYSLAHDKPARGVAGRIQFEADLNALIRTL